MKAQLPVCIMCLFLLAGCQDGHQSGQGENARDNGVSDVGRESEERVRACECAGLYYPDLTAEIEIPVLRPARLSLLQEAENRSEIISWAQSKHLGMFVYPAQSVRPHADWLAAATIGTSGRPLWWVFLYARRPTTEEDRKPWKLLYVGEGVFEAKPGSINSAEVLGEKKELIFLNAKGREIAVLKVPRVFEIVEQTSR